MKQNITNTQLEHLISETAKRVMVEKAEAIKGRPLNEGYIRNARTYIKNMISDMVSGLDDLYREVPKNEKLGMPYRKLKGVYESLYNLDKMLEDMESKMC